MQLYKRSIFKCETYYSPRMYKEHLTKHNTLCNLKELLALLFKNETSWWPSHNWVLFHWHLFLKSSKLQNDTLQVPNASQTASNLSSYTVSTARTHNSHAALYSNIKTQLIMHKTNSTFTKPRIPTIRPQYIKCSRMQNPTIQS